MERCRLGAEPQLLHVKWSDACWHNFDFFAERVRRRHRTRPSPFFPTIDTYTTELNWLATVEGRVGYAWSQLLVFGKAGWAGGNAAVTLTDNVVGITASDETFANGWTIGGGIECAHWPSIILGVEYSYTSLSFDASPNCPACGTDTSIGDGPPSISGDMHINAVMARATYLFKPGD
ncbi:MAG: outer membrane beta-barrel protein [Hyphomicrobium sp.]|nr:outer membrane beta-barrel protein [Hyphomicrobium sp.]